MFILPVWLKESPQLHYDIQHDAVIRCCDAEGIRLRKLPYLFVNQTQATLQEKSQHLDILVTTCKQLALFAKDRYIRVSEQGAALEALRIISKRSDSVVVKAWHLKVSNIMTQKPPYISKKELVEECSAEVSR